MLAVLKVTLLHVIATTDQPSPVLYHDVTTLPSLNFGATPILLSQCGICAGVCFPVAPAGVPICPKEYSSQPLCGGKREEAVIYSRVAESVSTSSLVGDVQATVAVLMEERIRIIPGPWENNWIAPLPDAKKKMIDGLHTI